MMGFLPSPWLIIGVLLAILSTYEYGHHQGYKEKEAEDAVAIAAKNTEMSNVKDKADADLKQAQDKLTAAQSKLRDSIHSGDQRLYVRLAAPASNASSACGDSAPTAQLDPEFAQSLVAITDRGDQAIVQLNACIDTYNKMREIVNANPR